MILAKQHLIDATRGASPIIMRNDGPLDEGQIQIASFDCSLKGPVYAMRASALPHGETGEELIKNYKRYSFELREGKTKVLEKGCCYLIPLEEHLALPEDLRAVFSPKSSTGRCDVFVRVVSDRSPHYDRTPFGYNGKLYLEVVPLSFSIKITKGLELTQCRIISKETVPISNEDLSVFHSKYGILRDRDGTPFPNNQIKMRDGGLYYDIDLERDVVGFEAISSPIEELDLTKKEHQDPTNFWVPIKRPKNGQLVLTPSKFYLLATKQRTIIPPELCGEMLPYDVSSGEFRPHYAGFFDNGFGGEKGTTGVLEVRSREIPFRVVHGQPICRMMFYRTLEIPSKLYSGNYTNPGPSLSKHFKDRFEVWGN